MQAEDPTELIAERDEDVVDHGQQVEGHRAVVLLRQGRAAPFEHRDELGVGLLVRGDPDVAELGRPQDLRDRVLDDRLPGQPTEPHEQPDLLELVGQVLRQRSVHVGVVGQRGDRGDPARCVERGP